MLKTDCKGAKMAEGRQVNLETIEITQWEMNVVWTRVLMEEAEEVVKFWIYF